PDTKIIEGCPAPVPGVGIVLDRGGFIELDDDPRNGGDKSLAELESGSARCRRHGRSARQEAASTASSLTPGGATHISTFRRARGRPASNALPTGSQRRCR